MPYQTRGAYQQKVRNTTRRFGSPRCCNTAAKACPRAFLPITVQCVDEGTAVVLVLACPPSGAVAFRDAASDDAVRQGRNSRQGKTPDERECWQLC